MPIHAIPVRLSFLLMIALTSAYAIAEAQVVRIFSPKSLDNKIIEMVELTGDEEIELDKSLAWLVNGQQYYFLPVTSAKGKSCRFAFLDMSKQKKIGSDSAYQYDRCTVITKPEVVDLNNDGYLDFRVYLKIPHQIGAKALVDHHFDFTYRPEYELFCDVDSDLPCRYLDRQHIQK